MAQIQELLHRIIENIETVIVGKRRAAELSLTALLCEGHVLIEDVPGVGKTSLVSALARSVDCSFRRIQFTPDILPSDITGFSMFNQKSGQFEYKEGLVFSSFVLADEINRTSPKTQASLLEVMEERHVTVDGVTRSVSLPFMVMATQNPIDYLGTYPLPEAQMDRFLMRVRLGYPETSDEIGILRRYQKVQPMKDIQPVAKAEDIIGAQSTVREIFVQDSLHGYIVDLLNASRRHPDVELGASPRGGIALMRAAQAWALYQDRSYILPDDIKLLAGPVLAHRLIMKQEARLRGVSEDDVVEALLRSVPVPVVSEYDS